MLKSILPLSLHSALTSPCGPLRHAWVYPPGQKGISSVQLLSHVYLFVTPRTAERHVSLSITNSWALLKLLSIELVMPCNHLILCHPISSHLQSFLASQSFQMNQFFSPGGQSIGVSASASILPVNIQYQFPLGLTGWNPLQSNDSQESTLQFKSISSSALSFLYNPTLTSLHDYGKNHSFD